MLTALDFFYPALLLFAAAGFWSVLRVRPDKHSARWFAAAYVAGAMAFTAELFRFAVSDFFMSIIAGGAFNLLSLGFVVGLILRADRKPPMKILIGLSVSATLMGAVLSLTALPVYIRICVAQFFAGMTILIGIAYCRHRLSAKVDLMVMSLMATLAAILFAAPILSYLTGDLPQTPASYDVSPLFNQVRLAVGSLTLAMAMLLVWEYVAGAISDLRNLADRDKLTGLLNRRGFESKLQMLRVMAQADEKQVALILFDLDFFKSVNDNFGHCVGDAVIKAMADVLNAHSGEEGIAARLGGEEFVMALPVASLDEADKVAELIRNRWQRRVHYAGDTEFGSTVSIGVALNTPRETGVLATLARADEALYLAKNSGRNKIVSETDLNVAKLRLSAARRPQEQPVEDAVK